MKYNNQTDGKWKDAIMTSSPTWVDYLGQWGCLATCIANIIQERNESEFTPYDLNEYLISHKGYNYLARPNVQEQAASLLEWAVVEKKYKLKHSYADNHVRVNPHEKKDVYYIIEVPAKMWYRGRLIAITHFMNALDTTDRFVIAYNGYDGEVVFTPNMQIIRNCRVEF